MISSSSMTRIVPLRVVAISDGPAEPEPYLLLCGAPHRQLARSGSVSVNRVPWPTALSQRIAPSCS